MHLDRTSFKPELAPLPETVEETATIRERSRTSGAPTIFHSRFTKDIRYKARPFWNTLDAMVNWVFQFSPNHIM